MLVVDAVDNGENWRTAGVITLKTGVDKHVVQ